MPLFGKTVDTVTEADLKALCADAVPESRSLDFKRELPGDTPDAKREFLKDTSALANATGGVLAYGIDEEDGCAASITGAADPPSEKVIARLTQMLRTSVEPPLTGVEMHAVAVDGGARYVLLVDVPASIDPPHRVAMGGALKFYIRSNTVSDEMTMEEMRAAFRSRTAREAEMEEFRLHRLKVLCGEVAPRPPRELRPEGALLMHIVPLMPRAEPIDVKAVAVRSPQPFAAMADGTGLHPEFTFDGLVFSTHSRRDGAALGYTVIFRNGTIESARGRLCMELSKEDRAGVVGRVFFADTVAEHVILTMPRYLGALKDCGIRGPLAVMMSVVGVGEAVLHTPRNFMYPDRVRCDRNILQFPPVLLESADLPKGWESALQPTFDMLWQAFGFEGCPFFNADGAWIAPRA